MRDRILSFKSPRRLKVKKFTINPNLKKSFNLRIIETIFEGAALLYRQCIRLPAEFLPHHLEVTVGHGEVPGGMNANKYVVLNTLATSPQYIIKINTILLLPNVSGVS